jgi:hypothetical protein
MPIIALGHGMEDDDDICIEVDNKDVKGLQIGDEIEISVKGLVEKLELGDDVCPAYIRLELSSRTVKKIGPNQFDKLLSEEEHEDDEPDLMDEDEDAA